LDNDLKPINLYIGIDKTKSTIFMF